VRGVGSRLVLVALALAAIACVPELDWREVRSAEGGFVAILPGRARLEERELSGRPGMVMHLWSARAGDAVYGVGYADAPGADVSLVIRTRDALVANVAGRIVADREIASGPARGHEFTVEGAQTTLIARVLVSGRRLYQVALIGRPGRIDASAVETFFSSFRLMPPE
jgi:hypothetical protein